MSNVVYINEYLKAKSETKITWLEVEPPTDEQLAWQMFLTKLLDYYEEGQTECIVKKS